MLYRVVLVHEEWTPESGLVTPAQKIQRAKIAKRFEVEIKVSWLFLRFSVVEVVDDCVDVGGVWEHVVAKYCCSGFYLTRLHSS